MLRIGISSIHEHWVLRKLRRTPNGRLLHVLLLPQPRIPFSHFLLSSAVSCHHCSQPTNLQCIPPRLPTHFPICWQSLSEILPFNMKFLTFSQRFMGVLEGRGLFEVREGILSLLIALLNLAIEPGLFLMRLLVIHVRFVMLNTVYGLRCRIILGLPDVGL